MGKLEAEGGNCAGALVSFRKALEVLPDDPEALAGVAACDQGAPKPLAAKK
jgi:Flp pilus assembly protein TadD